jgi:tRNA(fMet)-specific endonuclease VapC
MKYVLDTDTLIYFLKGDESVIKRFASTAPSDLSTTIINRTELLFGAFNSLKVKQNLSKIHGFLDKIRVLPFCNDASLIFAEQKATLKKAGNIVADLDLMIASIAIQNKSILVTNNTKHFMRLKKLKLENWTHN